ncbi:MAG: hypothetical protein ACFE95_10805 [Candidatus Hodarchaeota archaeon]
MLTQISVEGKLEPNEEDFLKLRNTLKIYREVCNYISKIAYNEGCFNSVALHHLTYKKVRMKYNLPANLAVRAREKVIAAYKRSRKKLLVFKSVSMDLDSRLLSISSNENVVVSITTINKRIKSKFVIEPSYKRFLKNPIVQAKLILRSNEFILIAKLRLKNTQNHIE